MTVLTKHQTRVYGPAPIAGWGHGATLTATVRYDDSCGNGHNSFGITGEIRLPGRKDIEAGGTLHSEIARVFPPLAPHLRWHLCSSDGPLHYVANTLYWLGYNLYCDGKEGSPPNLAHARKSAIWPELPETWIASHAYRPEGIGITTITHALESRLPELLTEFRAATESLGLVY